MMGAGIGDCNATSPCNVQLLRLSATLLVNNLQETPGRVQSGVLVMVRYKGLFMGFYIRDLDLFWGGRGVVRSCFFLVDLFWVQRFWQDFFRVVEECAYLSNLNFMSNNCIRKEG